MKKWICTVLMIGLLVTMAACAAGEGNVDDTASKDKVQSKTEANDQIGDYQLTIDGCRLAKDYEGKDVAIVKYTFTNNSDDATAFDLAFSDKAYQNGVGLNGAYVLDDSADYDSSNKTKEIKTGASLEVEVAYQLNDTTTDIEIEVEELFSFDDTKITKTFALQ